MSSNVTLVRVIMASIFNYKPCHIASNTGLQLTKVLTTEGPPTYYPAPYLTQELLHGLYQPGQIDESPSHSLWAPRCILMTSGLTVLFDLAYRRN